MKAKRIWKLGIITLSVLGAVVFWRFAWQEEVEREFAEDSANDRSADVGRSVPRQSDPDATSVQGTANSSSGGSVESLIAEVSSLEPSWLERYPDAEVEEFAIEDLGEGRFMRRQLLATGGQRIKHVVWEENFLRGLGAGWVLEGRLAYMADVVIVELKEPQLSEVALDRYLEQKGWEYEKKSRFSGYALVKLPRAGLQSVDQAIEGMIAAFPGALIERDHLRFTAAVPNDWDASRMWGLDAIRAPDAWEFETGDEESEVVVAVIDTGMHRGHGDLAGNLFVNPRDPFVDGIDGNAEIPHDNGYTDDVSGWDFVYDDPDPNDEDGHGTHVAGIVGASGDNRLGTVGVNWKVKLLPLKVGDFEGLRTSAINEALSYVSQLKRSNVNIVATNNSYGSGGSNITTQNEIRTHESLGILFVAASGNDGKNMDASPIAQEYPAGYDVPNIISVGNSNQGDQLSATSNYGIESVDISAPGTEILSTYPFDQYTYLSGTSMASPMVAGAVALLANAEPELSAEDIKKRLMDTADPIAGQQGLTVSGGRLNVFAALRPELAGHELRVSNIGDAFVLMDGIDSRLRLVLEAHRDAVVTALVVEGQAVGSLVDQGGQVFTYEPRELGAARLRFVSRLGGIERMVEKRVFVGDVSDVRDGLIHHFDFSGQGSTTPDLARGVSGTMVGATRLNSEFGSSLKLDSSNEKVSYNGVFSEKVTIAALVRNDNMVASAHPRIVNMPYYYLYFSSGEGLGVPDGNRHTLKFYSNFTNFGVWNTPPNSVQENEWYYLVGTFDSNSLLNTPELYINGMQQVVRLQQEPSGSMIRTGGLSYIGNNDSDDRMFSGLIGDVRVYDRLFSPEDVAQLGASLVQENWDSYKIVGPLTAQLGSSARFAVQDGDAAGSIESVEWSLESLDGVELGNSVGNSLEVRFNAVGENRIHVQISDGLSTYVMSMPVETINSQTQSGRYTGDTNGGGKFAIEIDDDLQGGKITIFDPDSGYYRIQEAITLDESGYFETEEESVGKIVGTALSVISGQIAGYAVNFESETVTPSSSASEFAGHYSGGGIGVLGDRIDLEVHSDGMVTLIRQGPHADLGLTMVDEEGRISGESVFGLSFDLSVDGETGRVAGQWGEAAVFLADASLETQTSVFGGLALGSPSGGEGSGLFVEFHEVGTLRRSGLEIGRYASRPFARSFQGSFVVIDEIGRTIPVRESDLGQLPDWVATALEGGQLEMGRKELMAIRAQLAVNEAAMGMIGFRLEGEEPAEILVRGLGPSFALGDLEDPSVRLYRLEEGLAIELGSNDDWREGALFTGVNEKAQGAFIHLLEGFEALDLSALGDEAKDAAFRVWLEPGDYLIEVSVAQGSDGPALIELLPL